LGRTGAIQPLAAFGASEIRNVVRLQFSDDHSVTRGDSPSPGGGYAEKRLKLESMKAGLGAKAKVQRKKAILEHCIEHRSVTQSSICHLPSAN
jgi:hypothetical protein